MYTFLGLKLKSNVIDSWFATKNLPDEGFLSINLEKWGSTFCACLEYEGLYLDVDHCDSAELALDNLLEKLRSKIKPLVDMGV